MLFALVLCALTAFAQDNDKILNRQYVDQKKIHFGFSVGTNFQDIHIVNNGFQTEDGETWFADVPQHSPGFCVNVLADLRLSKNFNLRFSPGMYFGNKVVKYINSSAPDEVTDPLRRNQSQNIKSTYIVLPLDLKISANRYHNVRPYFTGGVMGVFDVAKDHRATPSGEWRRYAHRGHGLRHLFAILQTLPRTEILLRLEERASEKSPRLGGQPRNDALHTKRGQGDQQHGGAHILF